MKFHRRWVVPSTTHIKFSSAFYGRVAKVTDNYVLGRHQTRERERGRGRASRNPVRLNLNRLFCSPYSALLLQARARRFRKRIFCTWRERERKALLLRSENYKTLTKRAPTRKRLARGLTKTRTKFGKKKI